MGLIWRTATDFVQIDTTVIQAGDSLTRVARLIFPFSPPLRRVPRRLTVYEREPVFAPN